MDEAVTKNALMVETVRGITRMLNEMDTRYVEHDDFYIYTVPDTERRDKKLISIRMDSPFLTMKYTWLVLVIDGQPYLRKREEILKLRKGQSPLIEIGISRSLFSVPFNVDQLTKLKETQNELKEAKQQITVLRRELKRLRDPRPENNTPEERTKECVRCDNVFDIDRFKDTLRKKDKSGEMKTYIVYRKECHHCRYTKYKKPRIVAQEQT